MKEALLWVCLAVGLGALLPGCALRPEPMKAVWRVTYQHLRMLAAPLPSGVWETEPSPGCTRDIEKLHDPSDAIWWEWFEACPEDNLVTSQTYDPPLDQPADKNGKRWRKTVWNHGEFVSLAYGDWDHPIVSLDRGPRVHAFQIYYGTRKKDGTVTNALRLGQLGKLGRPEYQTWTVYTTTAKEMQSIRTRDLAVECQVDDPAGC